MLKILENSTIKDNIFEYDKDNFDKPYLLLENMFIDKKIYYTFEQYKKHLNQTKKFKNKNYTVLINKYKTFSNITITIVENNYVIISKNENPCIHFIIRHPKLMDAINNFTPLVKE